MKRRQLPMVLAALVCVVGIGAQNVLPSTVSATTTTADRSAADTVTTKTPIKHLVVIFQENISFDHYFATYPQAANLPGEPTFTADPATPSVNGLNEGLLAHNPNLTNPVRLTAQQALTCDMGHGYTAEQKAFDNGLMDKFVQYTEGSAYSTAQYCPKGIVMDYFDGNTVTAMWNYAQHFAMNDNSFNTTFGPSTPGAINLISGETAGAMCGPISAVTVVAPCGNTPPVETGISGTVFSDSDPYYDDCSKGGTIDKSKTIAMAGTNIGDQLNAAGLTWGWFEGGFAKCTVAHAVLAYDQLMKVNPATDPNGPTADYIPHHEPFQYYADTSNPHHLPPTSVAMIGQTDQANHQYDLTAFWQAADAGNLPAVSFLKAPAYQDGHAGYSDPLDEQAFLVATINHLESLPSWSSTAIVINYDDSDGWYDHVMSPIVNQSHTSLDIACGSRNNGSATRCGYGPRLPYLVISPWAKTNFVDSTLTDQSSTLRFIEDNWLGGSRIDAQSFDNTAGTILNMFDFSTPAPTPRVLKLDPVTGNPA